jgi:hypothetical protein
MRWKTNWPWHKICCHGSKQPAHTTSLRRELYQSILPPWPGLSRNGTPGRPLTLFGACADYLLLIFRDLHGGHSPAVFSPHRWSCCLLAQIRCSVLHVPPNKCHCMMNRGLIGDRWRADAPFSASCFGCGCNGGVKWHLAHKGREKEKWKETKRRNSLMKESKKN